MVLTLLILIVILTGVSLWLRVVNSRHNISNGVDTRVSPLSVAIQELVGTAGGIYLAVIALTSFLKLDVPEKVTFLQITFDPLAFSAIGAAIAQPIITRAVIKLISR
ncbi:MAG: hypothetical protein P4N59_19295 [Negativicutes bacterium]|nr:hypothetical protein [Negativicutes bacterium]